MPATSATTTNHYIINNLNFIGTPNSSRPPILPEQQMALLKDEMLKSSSPG